MLSIEGLADSTGTDLEEVVFFSLSPRLTEGTKDLSELEPLDSLGLLVLTVPEESAASWVPSWGRASVKVVSTGDQSFFEVDSLPGEPKLHFLESF